MNTTTLFNQFTQLVSGSQFAPGTNSSERTEIWENFRQTFPDHVTLDFGDGIIVKLTATHSESSKSTYYDAPIDREIFKCLTGGHFGLSKTRQPSLSIQFGRIVIYGGGFYRTTLDNSKVKNIF